MATLSSRKNSGDADELARTGSNKYTTNSTEKSTGLLSRITFRLWGRRNKIYGKQNRKESTRAGGREDAIEEIELRKFNYTELHKATIGFSPERMIGKGGAGIVYRGILTWEEEKEDRYLIRVQNTMEMHVAVKKIVNSIQEERENEIASEIKTIGRLHHKNVVRLLGWCYENNCLFLVHEFVPNGSLRSHLYGSSLPRLPWELRYKIVMGLASAISYLQEGWEQCVVHRDIKSSNILLDQDFNPKLTDFDLARLAREDDRNNITEIVAGTKGYLAPEYLMTGHFSRETDIYSFGVVVLEIACGRGPIDKTQLRANQNLVDWVAQHNKKNHLLKVVDPRLGDAFNKKEMEKLLTLALLCTQYEPGLRPSIQIILKRLAARKADRHVKDTIPPAAMPTEIHQKNLDLHQHAKEAHNHDHATDSSMLISPGRTSYATSADTHYQEGMMPYFLTDVDDYQTTCFQLTKDEAIAAAISGANRVILAQTNINGTSASIIPTTSMTDTESFSNTANVCPDLISSPTYDDDQEKNDKDTLEHSESVTTCGLIMSDGQSDEELPNSGSTETSCYCWDIGIPPEYNSEAIGEVNDHHQPIMSGFMASLEKLMLKYENKTVLQFDEVLNSIRKYTEFLVSLGVPLVDWNSLAQQVLRASKVMDTFLNSMDIHVVTSSATNADGPLPFLRAKISECTSTIEKDGTMLESIKTKLALVQHDRSSLLAKLADLDNQIRETKEEVMAIDEQMTRHLELKRKSSAILDQYEAAISALSSSTCEK